MPFDWNPIGSHENPSQIMSALNAERCARRGQPVGRRKRIKWPSARPCLIIAMHLVGTCIKHTTPCKTIYSKCFRSCLL